MCITPLVGYRARKVNPSGRRSVVFDRKFGFADLEVELPCGQCIECRIRKAREWAMRCMHESSCHEDSSFLTLTYEKNPVSLSKRDLQLFFKKLRKAIGVKIRYFACGEYGKLLGRPHYHVLLFGFEFPDKKFYTVRDKYRVYTSALLEACWDHGLSEIGMVTTASAQYVAKYVIKQVTGDRAKEYYGERVHEFSLKSQGLGKEWISKYADGVSQREFVVVDGGRKCGIPRYYRQRLSDDVQRELKRNAIRRMSTPEMVAEQEFWRRYARQEVLLSKAAMAAERSEL